MLGSKLENNANKRTFGHPESPNWGVENFKGCCIYILKVFVHVQFWKGMVGSETTDTVSWPKRTKLLITVGRTANLNQINATNSPTIPGEAAADKLEETSECKDVTLSQTKKMNTTSFSLIDSTTKANLELLESSKHYFGKGRDVIERDAECFRFKISL